MPTTKQVSVFLENKPGRLAKICSALAHEKVDLRALSVMDTNGRSVLRFVTDHIEEMIPLAGRSIADLNLVLGFQQSPEAIEFYKQFRGR